MLSARFFIATFLLIVIALAAFFYFQKKHTQSAQKTIESEQETGQIAPLNELTIDYLKNQNYPGSDLTIEEKLSDGTNYSRYIASYKSQGNKIYGLLTVPNGDKGEKGFPAIVFNHGFIPPKEYRTTEKYVAYQDAFARNGYVVFKPDYRGHGSSEGEAVGAYGSPAYTIDVLNALASVKKYSEVNPDKIGMWGHSMGGYITLRSLVVSKDIKAAVIWAGVVGSYEDILYNWRRSSVPPLPSGNRRWRDELLKKYGNPKDNPTFWNSISANSYLSDISAPVQLHHGTADSSVPIEFSKKLEEQLKTDDKTVELFTYDGDDHNIGNNLSLALSRSVEFFDKYLK